MREKVLKILEEIRPDIDFVNEKSLLDSELLDSYDIICLLAMLGDEFGLDLSPDDISFELFNSLDGICSVVEENIHNM